MKAHLITQLNEVTVRDYTLVEDEGINALVSGSANHGNSGIAITYEDDEESPDKHMIVISAPDLDSLFKFLDFAEIPVRIVT